MKASISLIFLLLHLISASPVEPSKPKWCPVPPEFCTGGENPHCTVPIGWSCSDDGTLAKREPVTVTATHPKLARRDPAIRHTATPQKISIKTLAPSILPGTPITLIYNTTNTPQAHAGGFLPPPPWYGPPNSTSSSSADHTPSAAQETTSPAACTPKPILEVSCVDRSRLLWNDFKITWGPAWNDQAGCRRLYKELDKRGLVTGYHCAQVADQESNTWMMEARGHRPRFPRSLVADAIRAAFARANTIYYRGYESRMLCEKVRTGGGLFGK